MMNNTAREIIMLPKTIQGIQYISLIDDEHEYDIQEMTMEALSNYHPYHFQNKIEVFVFYTDRAVFSDYILSEYGIIDDDSDDRPACHHAYGTRSVLGVEASGLETTGQITYVLGRSLEYSRIRLEDELGATHAKQPGYGYWVEFFSQTTASVNRQKGSAYPDSYLKAFIEMLPYKEEMFNETEIDETFLHLIYAMSDLFYYYKNDKEEMKHRYLVTLKQQTDEGFVRMVKELFHLLTDYLNTAGEFYTAPHDYAVFDKIESHKKQMTSYFN